jgi:biopolymer transport protein ExbD
LDFNITPLIDIVFLLIIFFLTVSHFARSENLEQVALPEATQDDTDNSSQRLIVTITSDGRLHVGSREIDLPNLELMIQAGLEEHSEALEVHIRADRQAVYRDVEPVILACARNGVRKVKWRTVLKSAQYPHSKRGIIPDRLLLPRIGRRQTGQLGETS